MTRYFNYFVRFSLKTQDLGIFFPTIMFSAAGTGRIQQDRGWEDARGNDV